MATIGQPLMQPEQGWKRYDDTDSAIKYANTVTHTQNTNAYNGGYHAPSNTKVAFNFTGTKIRIIGYSNTSTYSDLIQIKIDEIPYNFSQMGSVAGVYQALNFEHLELENKIHVVEIENKSTKSSVWLIDAIDIDSTGRLLHPDEVTDIKDLEIGKRIRCHYQTTTADTVGTFSNLGQETSDFISVASSNVPNGDFYWIMVENENKKKKLIADRNIQHSISWDTLNSSGISSGSGLPVNWIDNSRYFSAIRLLTGGINSSDKDNEWDKYVTVDNNVWNTSTIYSLTSSTHPSSPSNRVSRATTQNNLVAFGQIATNSVFANSGFRPVLTLEDILKTHTFIKLNNQYKTFKNNQWNNISTTLPAESVSISEGMQNLTILDRKESKFTQNMSNNGSLGEGKVFKSSIDLKKLFEIKSIQILSEAPTYATETAIPQMLSNTNPSGRAFASSIHGANSDAWKAFDRTENSYSSSDGSGGIGHLGYKFVNHIKIGKYAVRNTNVSSESIMLPKDWTFEGSNDGVNWTVLDTQVDQSWTATLTDRNYFINISKINSYKMYRLNWTANNGYANFTAINEFKMYEVYFNE